MKRSIQHGFESFDDEDCIEILRKCKEAIPGERGKVMFAETVLDAKATRGLAAARMCMDMMMLPAVARERTEEEYLALITSAGFTDYKIATTEDI
ncbi:hypothetical protein ACLOJK_029667 [Asimina triloba]